MIFGKKSCIRRTEREDYAQVWIWWNDPQIQKLTNRQCFPPGFEMVEDWYNRSFGDEEKAFFIIHAFDKNTIGTIDLYNIDWRNRYASIEIMIGEKEYLGKGYGQDALMTILKFAFNDLKLKRIEGKIVEYNERAIKCFEKCGFQKEGKLRKRILWDGVYHDQYIMGVLEEDYQLLQTIKSETGSRE